MASDSDTVRAARLHKHGEPLVVEAVTLGEPPEGEVRVQLQFGGVNPIDRYTAEGQVAPDAPLPRTLGGEASGTLDGRPVLVAGGGLGATRDGVWAQAAHVPRDSVVPVPDGVELRFAAAMGVAGLTAYNVVHQLGRVEADDRVLVLGASGGVGSMIVSLASSIGATVWGQTGSRDKSDLVEQLGAARVLLSDGEQLSSPLSELKPTVVFDPLGGPFVAPVIEALTPRGRLVSFGTSAGAEVSFNLQSVYRKSLSILGYGGGQLGVQERRAGLEAALQAVKAGELRVQIDSVLPLDDVNEAFARIAQRRVQGKLVLDLS